MIKYLDKTLRPLVLIMPEIRRYVKMFSFRIDVGKLLEKYKAIWMKIEDLKNNKLSAVPVHDDRYIKTKIRKFGDTIYANFRG